MIEEQADVAVPARLLNDPITVAPIGGIEGQVARLSDPRLQAAQREALAAQIGQGQGNQHLQRVIADGTVQRRKNKKKAAAPVLLTEDQYRLEIQNGQDAKQGFEHAASKGSLLYNAITLQAESKTIHEELTEGYKEAKETLRKLNEKSDLMKVFEAITTIVDFATSLVTIVGAARTILKSAKSFKSAYDLYKDTKTMPDYDYMEYLGVVGSKSEEMWGAAKKGGKAVYEGGKGVYEGGKAVKGAYESGSKIFASGGGGATTAETLLSDTNAAAIEASNAALDRLVEGTIEYYLLDFFQDGEKAGLNLQQMTDGVETLGRAGKVIPDAGLSEIEKVISAAEQQRKKYEDRAKQLKQVWEAYMAGGAEAIANPTDRSLFEKIAAWKRAGDPKADALHIALDQDTQDVWFSGTGVDMDPHFGSVTFYSCHEFDQDQGQLDRGILYITDPAVEKELEADLRPYFLSGFAELLEMWGLVGSAQKKMDPKYAGASRHMLSISGAKALISLGVDYTRTDATIHLYNNGTFKRAIHYYHKGDWFDQWWDTPDFKEFWQTELGEKWGFLWDKDKKKRIEFDWADKAKREESTEVEIMDSEPML